jgi:hypothetical protein
LVRRVLVRILRAVIAEHGSFFEHSGPARYQLLHVGGGE